MLPRKRLLVLTTNHVGNNLFCTAGIRLLKRHLPDAEIDVVVMSPRGASVFAHNPDIRQVHLCFWRWQVRWLARRYDMVIGLHHNVARPYLEGLGAQAVLLNPPPPDTHGTEALLQSVGTLLGRAVTDADRHYRLCPQPADFAAIDRHLARASQDSLQQVGNAMAASRSTNGNGSLARALGHGPLGQDSPLVGLHLGSGRTAVHGWKFWYARRDTDPRIWPLERYVALVELLRAVDPRVRVVITGSRNEKFLARRFVRRVPDAVDLVGKTSLLEMAALMSRLSVFVTHDNGALHVACAMGVRLVGLFGPTQPHRTGPFPRGAQNIILKEASVDDIQPQRVCAAVVAQIRAGQASPLANAEGAGEAAANGASS